MLFEERGSTGTPYTVWSSPELLINDTCFDVYGGIYGGYIKPKARTSKRGN
jgi:hypothetical protein